MKRNKEKQGVAKRKTHPLELKLQVLQQLRAGAAVSDVCRAFGLAVTTVALWRQAYAQGGYEALFPKTPGPTKAKESGPDARREAVIALKQADPAYGTLRIVNGKIAEYWAYADSLLFVQQLGLSEVPGATPAH